MLVLLLFGQLRETDGRFQSWWRGRCRAPDVAIIGKDATGAEKVVLLAVDNPVLTATTAVFESIPLTPTKDAPIYKGGPVAAFLTELSNVSGPASDLLTLPTSADTV